MDEFVCLKSKAYSFKCDDENTNTLNGISDSQSEIIKFEDFKRCLDGENYQSEEHSYILWSPNHEIYLQKLCNPTLSFFYDKRTHLKNNEVLPWN